MFFAFLTGAMRAGVADAAMIDSVLDSTGGIFEHVRENGGSAYVERQIARAREQVGDQVMLDPSDPMRSARTIIPARYTTTSGHRTIHRHRGTFWRWTGNHYQNADDEMMRSEVWQFLKSAMRASERGPVPFKPSRARVGDVIDALGAICQLSKHVDPPAWLNMRIAAPAVEFFAAANGLLHLPTQALCEPTPEFFGLIASEATFDANAPRPDLWLAFLNQVIGDAATIDMIQEWFGYTLASDTTQQKILLGVGPRRSGKGTLARTQAALLGKNSVAGPTMAQLGEHFGLEPLITKGLAIVSDARIGGRETDRSVIVERLLAISGEDQMTVPRKFLQAWNGRLPTRFAIFTNELPSLRDQRPSASSSEQVSAVRLQIGLRGYCFRLSFSPTRS